MDKKMGFIKARTIYELVDSVNEKGIKKEDIVNMMCLSDCYILIYFG